MLGEPGWKTRKMIACFACAIAANTSFMSGGVGDGPGRLNQIAAMLKSSQVAPAPMSLCDFVRLANARLDVTGEFQVQKNSR
jgi:hypothetical protein